MGYNGREASIAIPLNRDQFTQQNHLQTYQTKHIIYIAKLDFFLYREVVVGTHRRQ